ncbi:hypothetical protein [Actinoplanes octamycinicus]|uniref:hypothetical protein n=1 Tax=Actinoplanes octamycinicus TaxID=135948 RepID=UPI0035E9ADFF
MTGKVVVTGTTALPPFDDGANSPKAVPHFGPFGSDDDRNGTDVGGLKCVAPVLTEATIRWMAAIARHRGGGEPIARHRGGGEQGVDAGGGDRRGKAARRPTY